MILQSLIRLIVWFVLGAQLTLEVQAVPNDNTDNALRVKSAASGTSTQNSTANYFSLTGTSRPVLSVKEAAISMKID